jgi:hypothetical protein
MRSVVFRNAETRRGFDDAVLEVEHRAMIARHSAGSTLGLCLLLGSTSCAAPHDAASEGSALGLSEQEEPVPALGGRGVLASIAPAASIADYRMGDEFGKKPVNASLLATATDAYKRAARATAKVGGATGFYLGKFGDVHVMATNHHVQPSMSCSGRTATFPLLDNLRFSCRRVFGSWPSVDLALFEITVPRPEDEAKLASVAANFTFDDEIVKGAPLITIGFGIAGNAQRVMMGNEDSDCRVLSKTGEYQLMADPDELNPGSYKAWSFSHTCDISHGDSGSAMVDRRTGRPVGIVWTGRIPKNASVQSSAYLDEVLSTDHADVWTEMNYAVPASKIREHIEGVIATASTPEATREVLAEIIRPVPPPPAPSESEGR